MRVCCNFLLLIIIIEYTFLQVKRHPGPEVSQCDNKVKHPPVWDRAGRRGLPLAVLPHHWTYGSVSGGSVELPFCLAPEGLKAPGLSRGLPALAFQPRPPREASAKALPETSTRGFESVRPFIKSLRLPWPLLTSLTASSQPLGSASFIAPPEISPGNAQRLPRLCPPPLLTQLPARTGLRFFWPTCPLRLPRM